jgi:diguanylate cyclase (GGDEF)-like protein
LGSLDPEEATLSEDYRTLAKCASLAAQLADIWVRPGYWRHSAHLAERAEQLFNLNGEEYVEVLEAISEKFPELADLFQIKSLDSIEVAGILDQAREILTIHNARHRPFALSRRSTLKDSGPSVTPLLPKSLPVTAVTVSPPLERDVVNISQQYAFDTLTGLYNRQQFEELLGRGLASAKAQQWPLSVALLAVDDWVPLLKANGRVAGDQILIALARLFGANIRRHDVVARYSSVEFAFLMPSSDAVATCSLLERLQGLVCEWQPLLDGRQCIEVSISVGFVTYPEASMAEASATTLLQAAEEALRLAQRVNGSLVRYGEHESRSSVR